MQSTTRIDLNHAVTLALVELRAGRPNTARDLLNAAREAAPGDTYVEAARALLAVHERLEQAIDQTIETSSCFYAPNESCQVSNLGELYEAHLGRKRSGVFVEVGAFDGRTCSNTDFLPPLGWSGLYIEPVPAYFQQCLRWHGRYPKVRFENVAAGSKEAIIEMHVAGVLSTANPNVKDEYLRIAWAAPYFANSEKIPVFVRPLDEILTSHQIAPRFDILVVDTEGYEGEVFRGFSLEKWLPKLVIIELVGNASAIGRIASIAIDEQDIRVRFEDCGYSVAYSDHTNTVFVRS
jgi:FkbM family methyltransferase